jgi:hypothetical protein
MILPQIGILRLERYRKATISAEPAENAAAISRKFSAISASAALSAGRFTILIAASRPDASMSQQVSAERRLVQRDPEARPFGDADRAAAEAFGRLVSA